MSASKQYQVDQLMLLQATKHPKPCLKCHGHEWVMLSVIDNPSWKNIIYKHIFTNAIVYHSIAHWPDPIPKYTSDLIFLWRINHNYENVIKTHEFYQAGKAYSCGLKVNVNSVLVQYVIPFSQISLYHLNSNQLFTLMYSLALDWIKGFQKLSTVFQSFQLNEDMLLCDEKGVGKVWINKNYALNSAQKNVGLEGVEHQKYIVQHIFGLINKRIEKRGLAIKFEQRSFEEGRKGLSTILNCIKNEQQKRMKSANYSSLMCQITKNLVGKENNYKRMEQSVRNEKSFTAPSTALTTQNKYNEKWGGQTHINSRIYSDIEEFDKMSFQEVESELQVQNMSGYSSVYVVEESQIIRGNS